MSLGLGLMSLMIGTIDTVSRVSPLSQEAAEATERGYFLIDAIDTWLAHTSSMTSVRQPSIDQSRGVKPREGESGLPWPNTTSRSEAIVTAITEAPGSPLSAADVRSNDLCLTPDVAALPLEAPGIVVLDGRSWACIPQRHLENTAPVLLLEQRLLCWENCTDAGFYALSSGCVHLGDLPFSRVVWLDAERERPSCFSRGGAARIRRSLIYIRDYAWRVGDGVNAVMLRELAQERDARWLRSSMLAYAIDDWHVACVHGCRFLTQHALLSSAIDLRFSAISRDQSIAIHRVLTPRKDGYAQLPLGDVNAYSLE